SFTSTVLETIGKAGRAASTQYSVFVAAGNLAITYVGLVDTRFDANHGTTGVIASDATLNLLGVVILAIAFWRLGSFGKGRHPPEAELPAGSEPPAPPDVALPTATAHIIDKPS